MLPKLGWQADRRGGKLPSAFARIARTCLFALWHLQRQASPRPQLSQPAESRREKERMEKDYIGDTSGNIRGCARRRGMALP